MEEISPSNVKKIFYCYASEDISLRDELEKHVKRLPGLLSWHDGMISPGQNREQEFHTNLSMADIVLLLVSSDFLASDYYYHDQMLEVLERHRQGIVQIIPILLRPVLLEGTLFSRLITLPTNGEPVTLWPNQDAAFANIARALLEQVYEKHPQSDTVLENDKEIVSFTQKSRLVELLLACDCMRNSGSREAILRQLPEDIVYGIERHATAQAEVLNIVDHCLAYSGALHELIKIIQFFERGSRSMKQLDLFVDELSKKL